MTTLTRVRGDGLPRAGLPRAGLPQAARPGATASEEQHPRGRHRLLLRTSVPLGLVVVGFALFPAYRHGVGLDGLSYLAVAEAYAAGSWDAAVNAYWSPLYSWVHVPLLALGIEPLDAATLTAPLIAAGAVVALQRLLRTAGASDVTTWMVALAVSPMVLAWAHYGVFADLLLTALLLAATADLLDPRFARQPLVALRAGALLALAYLCKLYALPFAAVVLPGVLLLHGLVGRGPRRLLRSGALAAAAFVAVAAPWVAVLSADQGHLTAGTSAGHNIELVAPGSQGNPIFYAGLLPPDRPGAYSAWEDPSAMPVAADGWEEADADVSGGRILRNLRRNADAGWDALTFQGVGLLVAGALGALVWAVADRRNPVAVLGIGLAAGVYSGGYLLTWVEPRYAWFVLLLLAVPAGLLLERLTAMRVGQGGALAAALLLALALLPPATDELVLKWSSGRELAGIIADVEERQLVPPGAVVASADNWQRSAILCFRLDCTYLGIPAAAEGTARRAEMDQHDVERLLIWDRSLEEPAGPQPLGGPDELGGLRVYGLPRG